MEPELPTFNRSFKELCLLLSNDENWLEYYRHRGDVHSGLASDHACRTHDCGQDGTLRVLPFECRPRAKNGGGYYHTTMALYFCDACFDYILKHPDSRVPIGWDEYDALDSIQFPEPCLGCQAPPHQVGSYEYRVIQSYGWRPAVQWVCLCNRCHQRIADALGDGPYHHEVLELLRPEKPFGGARMFFFTVLDECFACRGPSCQKTLSQARQLMVCNACYEHGMQHFAANDGATVVDWLAFYQSHPRVATDAARSAGPADEKHATEQ